MERSYSLQPILILEGPSDARLFGRLLRGEAWAFVRAFGKDRLLSAIDILNNAGDIKGYIAFADADFDNVLGISHKTNVVRTDHHDIEIMMIESDAFETMQTECISIEALTRIERDHVSLRDMLYERLKPFSIVRLLNEKMEMGVPCDQIGLDHIEQRSLTPRIEKLLRQVHPHCRLDHVTYEEFALAFDDMHQQNLDMKQIARGRDVLFLIEMALKGFINSKLIYRPKADALEKMLRIGFTREAFDNSAAGNTLNAWRRTYVATVKN